MRPENLTEPKQNKTTKIIEVQSLTAEEHPFCALPEHYFDRYWDKSAFNGQPIISFEREPFHPEYRR